MPKKTQWTSLLGNRQDRFTSRKFWPHVCRLWSSRWVQWLDSNQFWWVATRRTAKTTNNVCGHRFLCPPCTSIRPAALVATNWSANDHFSEKAFRKFTKSSVVQSLYSMLARLFYESRRGGSLDWHHESALLWSWNLDFEHSVYSIDFIGLKTSTREAMFVDFVCWKSDSCGMQLVIMIVIKKTWIYSVRLEFSGFRHGRLSVN